MYFMEWTRRCQPIYTSDINGGEWIQRTRYWISLMSTLCRVYLTGPDYASCKIESNSVKNYVLPPDDFRRRNEDRFLTTSTGEFPLLLFMVAAIFSGFTGFTLRIEKGDRDGLDCPDWTDPPVVSSGPYPAEDTLFDREPTRREYDEDLFIHLWWGNIKNKNKIMKQQFKITF